MLIHRSTVLGGLLVTVTLAACGKSPLVSETKHDENTPTRGTYPWMWKSVSDADYTDVMAPLTGVTGDTVLPEGHALVKRTQFWLDHIDASVRAAQPAMMAHVPKPRAKVINAEVANAFVAPVPVCYQFGVQIRPGTGDTVDQVFLDMTTGGLERWPADQYKCVEAKDPADLVTFVQAFNSSSLACKYRIVKQRLVPNDQCPVTDLPAIAAARSVVVLETANHVTVFSGIIPMMSEPDFVAVLAHELGHYYRSHSTAPSDAYNYFYTLDPVEPDHKPTPEADKDDLGEGAVAAATLLSASDLFTQVAGQQLRSDLYAGVGSLIQAVSGQSDASAACQDAHDLLGSGTFVAAIGKFPFDRLTDAETAAYGTFEQKALACLATVTLAGAGTSSTLAGSVVTWDEVQRFISAPTWPAWVDDPQLSAKTRQVLNQADRLTATRIGTIPTAADLKTALLAVSASMAAQDRQSAETLKTAFDQHLGQYTIEQEADDESAEWIAHMGIDPETEVDTMRQLGKGSKDDLDGYQLGETACETLLAKHWTHDDGSPAFVPIGDYAEIHHSLCYRMFNIDREIKAHKHVAAKVSVPVADGPAWTDLQEAAKALVPAAGPATGNGLRQTAPLLKKDPAMGCIYATSYH